VVYCGGLENRCAGNRTGGSNPSPSAIRRENEMRELLPTIIVLLIASAAFIWFWREGAFLKVSGYFRDTIEELKKCSRPNMDELIGSTVVVLVSVALLGGFTMGVDFIVATVVKFLV
jgi:preprotein translocase SecE subunit